MAKICSPTYDLVGWTHGNVGFISAQVPLELYYRPGKSSRRKGCVTIWDNLLFHFILGPHKNKWTVGCGHFACCTYFSRYKKRQPPSTLLVSCPTTAIIFTARVHQYTVICAYGQVYLRDIGSQYNICLREGVSDLVNISHDFNKSKLAANIFPNFLDWT